MVTSLLSNYMVPGSAPLHRMSFIMFALIAEDSAHIASLSLGTGMVVWLRSLLPYYVGKCFLL